MKHAYSGLVAFIFLLGSAPGCSSPPAPPDAPVSRAKREPDRFVAPAGHVQPLAPSTEPAVGTVNSIPQEELQVTVRPFSEWTEQEVAADTLARIGADAVPALVQALKMPNAEARLRAVEVLGRMGADAKSAVPELVPLLDDPDLRVRKATARTLGRIGPEAADAIPALMRSLLTPPDP